MKALLVSVLALVCLTACTDQDGATKALEAAGYRNIHITGYVYFGCGEDDSYHTGFEAIGQNGRPVAGVVCAGVMKGSTIRVY